MQDLKGFGTKTETAILEGLDIATEADRRILWIEADQHVQEILRHMAGCKAVEKITAAGSYRRAGKPSATWISWRSRETSAP